MCLFIVYISLHHLVVFFSDNPYKAEDMDSKILWNFRKAVSAYDGGNVCETPKCIALNIVAGDESSCSCYGIVDYEEASLLPDNSGIKLFCMFFFFFCIISNISLFCMVVS